MWVWFIWFAFLHFFIHNKGSWIITLEKLQCILIKLKWMNDFEDNNLQFSERKKEEIKEWPTLLCNAVEIWHTAVLLVFLKKTYNAWFAYCTYLFQSYFSAFMNVMLHTLLYNRFVIMFKLYCIGRQKCWLYHRFSLVNVGYCFCTVVLSKMYNKQY